MAITQTLGGSPSHSLPIRPAKGETVWRWIALAFAAYWTLFVVGAYTGRQELNDIGAVFILGALGWAALERLWVKIDAVVAACFVAAVVPLIAALATHEELHSGAIVKFVSLCAVMALARLLRLPAVSGAQIRWVLAAQIMIILMLSVTTDRGGVWDGGTRHSGLFANPNNLALIPFLLLFFIDRRRDPLLLQILTHVVVIAVLAWTGTSGAVLAYVIGLAVYFGSAMPRTWRAPCYTLASVGALALASFIALGGESILPETRFTNQLRVMRSQLDIAAGGGEVAYYEQERVLGPGAASGIWRLVHWRRTLVTYLEGNPTERLFGFGIGSSPAMMGKLPHNEYLRVLFEQGAFGLALFLFAWARIIGNAPRDVRYCGLILAIYSFSENNLDNFPFMALFIICLSAVDPVDSEINSSEARIPFTYAIAS